jgi:hypothetical protein
MSQRNSFHESRRRGLALTAAMLLLGATALVGVTDSVAPSPASANTAHDAGAPVGGSGDAPNSPIRWAFTLDCGAAVPAAPGNVVVLTTDAAPGIVGQWYRITITFENPTNAVGTDCDAQPFFAELDPDAVNVATVVNAGLREPGDPNDPLPDAFSTTFQFLPDSDTVVTPTFDVGVQVTVKSASSWFFVVRGDSGLDDGFDQGDDEDDEPRISLTATNESGGTGLALNDVITISFNAGEEPVGSYFDTWICTGTSHLPDDDDNEGEAAEQAGCTPFLFWDRTGAVEQEPYPTLMSFRFGLEDTDAFSAANLGGTAFLEGMPGLLTWFDEFEGDGPFDDLCDINGLYFIVHDYSGGGHSNFLGPLTGVPCLAEIGSTSAEESAVASAPLALVCTPDPAVPGGSLTCEVSGGDPGIDVLWRASSDGSVFASTGVRLGSDGVGSFVLTVPRGAACGTITVELVEWLPPMTVQVACSVAPTRVPAGEGGLPFGGALGMLLGAAGALIMGRRMVTAG